jgi:hypothetical protein
MKLRWLGDGIGLIFDIFSSLFLYGVVVAVALFFALLSWTDMSMEPVLQTTGAISLASVLIGTVLGPSRRFAGSLVGSVLTGLSS